MTRTWVIVLVIAIAALLMAAPWANRALGQTCGFSDSKPEQCKPVERKGP